MPYHHRGRRWRPWLPRRSHVLIFLSLCLPFVIDVLVHRRQWDVPRPERELDEPFQTGCRDPDVDAARENAVLVMLARNSEVEQANHTVASLERHFNRWFHYPIVFLNDEPWSNEFVEVLSATASGEAKFEVIPQAQWTFPSWMDADAARQSMREQSARGVRYGGREGYHHMCRFYSGYVTLVSPCPDVCVLACNTPANSSACSHFYDLEVLKSYKWYWRLEPDVDFMCAITYDPFVEMARNRKRYGYTMALYEEKNTCPSLYRAIADYKEAYLTPTTNLWKALVQGSWMPFPFRRWTSWMANHDKYGDVWSTCHFWSNFEIGDFDFFRGREYQDLFSYLDRRGGFYFERVSPALRVLSGEHTS